MIFITTISKIKCDYISVTSAIKLNVFELAIYNSIVVNKYFYSRKNPQ
jgi:hypothetical protein